MLVLRVITYRRVEWAIGSFASYESPGLDGIFLALLQEEREDAIPYLVRIFRACLSTSYVPAIWRQVKVVFIPKPGRNSIADLGNLDLSVSHRYLLRPWRGW
jgi:hypothetical protein